MEQLGQYIAAGAALFCYIVPLVWYLIWYLPGGLAKFHSVLTALVSSLFGVLACLLFFTDFQRGSIERLVFYLLIAKAQFAYGYQVWDYLRLDDYIGSMQRFMILTANGLILFSSLILDNRAPGALTTEATVIAWILFSIAPVVFISWAGVCFFFRHRIGHREYIVIGFALSYFLGYSTVFALRSLMPVWAEVLAYALVFCFTHVPGLIITYWYDNLTKGISAYPWFASVYGYDNAKIKPSTEMIRQYVARFLQKTRTDVREKDSTRV